MLAKQWEFRRLVVVEADGAPFLTSVTSLTFLAVTATMCIFQSVTGDASDVEPFPLLVGMASATRDALMRADERKLRSAVVEGKGWLPGVDAVATIASLAQAATVGLVLFVTSDAL